jgi:hypothetical protein
LSGVACPTRLSRLIDFKQPRHGSDPSGRAGVFLFLGGA